MTLTRTISAATIKCFFWPTPKKPRVLRGETEERKEEQEEEEEEKEEQEHEEEKNDDTDKNDQRGNNQVFFLANT